MTPSSYTYRAYGLRLAGALYAAHLIKALGSREPLFELMTEPGYLPDLLAGTAITLLIWEWTGRASSWLDRSYDWLRHSVQRLLLQLLLGMALPALMIFGINSLYFRYVLGERLLGSSWLLIEYRVSLLLLLMINASFFCWYLYVRLREAEARLAEPRGPAAPPPGPLLAVKGSRQVPVQPHEMAYCCLEEGQYWLYTFGQERMLIPHTLDELEAMLPAELFFRLNRQVIAQRQACAAFAQAAHGKLEVTLRPPLPAPVLVSQKKAAAFKAWLISR
ncbi:MAG: LytTR family DNA-binding domain-containing protein [Bacteroidia bacterium]|nr:LytTR family DNA-binding domain-containing protein [Bacteroidia bacterium]